MSHFPEFLPFSFQVPALGQYHSRLFLFGLIIRKESGRMYHVTVIHVTVCFQHKELVRGLTGNLWRDKATLLRSFPKCIDVPLLISMWEASTVYWVFQLALGETLRKNHIVFAFSRMTCGEKKVVPTAKCVRKLKIKGMRSWYWNCQEKVFGLWGKWKGRALKARAQKQERSSMSTENVRLSSLQMLRTRASFKGLGNQLFSG